MSRLRQSRDRWKKKAIERGKELRDLRRSLRRAHSDRAEAKDVTQSAEEQVVRLERTDSNTLSDCIVQDRLQTIVLCVNIYLFGRVSFSCLPKILPLIGIWNWIPSPTAINEWVCKLGLKKLEMARSYTGQWIAIIDLSIYIAYRKVLAILRVPIETLGNPGSLKLADVDCVALQMRERWGYESIQRALNEALGEAERLMAIIKDGGTDLEKGVGLWRKSRRVYGPDDRSKRNSCDGRTRIRCFRISGVFVEG